MKKFFAILALPVLMALAACDMPPPEDGGVPPADPAAPATPVQ